jgi:nucleotide-binding universal stress UspA family protein
VTAWLSFKQAAPSALLALPGRVTADAAADLDAAIRQSADDLSAEGAALAREAGLEAQARAVASPGAYFAALVRTADELDAPVIVVGSRGRSMLAAAVLGSVSTGVIHHARRPVLIVPADEPAR